MSNNAANNHSDCLISNPEVEATGEALAQVMALATLSPEGAKMAAGVLEKRVDAIRAEINKGDEFPSFQA